MQITDPFTAPLAPATPAKAGAATPGQTPPVFSLALGTEGAMRGAPGDPQQGATLTEPVFMPPAPRADAAQPATQGTPPHGRMAPSAVMAVTEWPDAANETEVPHLSAPAVSPIAVSRISGEAPQPPAHGGPRPAPDMDPEPSPEMPSPARRAAPVAVPAAASEPLPGPRPQDAARPAVMSATDPQPGETSAQDITGPPEIPDLPVAPLPVTAPATAASSPSTPGRGPTPPATMGRAPGPGDDAATPAPDRVAPPSPAAPEAQATLP